MKDQTISALWRVSTRNFKTGPCVDAVIGATKQATVDSCLSVECALFKVCYAHNGGQAMSAASTRRSAVKGADKSIQAAINLAPRSIKIARHGAIGDGGVRSRVDYERDRDYAVSRGLTWIDYTHGWRGSSRQWLRRYAMASVETLAGALLASLLGWRVYWATGPGEVQAVKALRVYPQLPRDEWRSVVMCPATASSGRVTCSDCRRCDGLGGSGPHFYNPAHGSGASARSWARMQAELIEAVDSDMIAIREIMRSQGVPDSVDVMAWGVKWA